MKIYTRSGDDGTTGLLGGMRVPKTDARVKAYGSLDESNSAIGLARSFGLAKRNDEILLSLQNDLFRLSAEIATAPNAMHKLTFPLIDAQDIRRIEGYIDEIQAKLQPLNSFILPAGTSSACALHLARSIVRRSERNLFALGQDQVRPDVVQYVNRVSDLLFCLARSENQRNDVLDVSWSPGKSAANPIGAKSQ